MKRQLKGMLLLGICIFTGGCSMKENKINHVLESVIGKTDYQDVNVQTEDEMKAYATQRLEEKYGKSFEVASVLKYDHVDGEENRPMYLNGCAHVVGDDSLDCYFVVTEPNEFKDAHDYIPVIRAWMEKLYGADYDWYFELHDSEDKDKCYFTLDPGDNSFSSAADWDDELIYEYFNCKIGCSTEQNIYILS